MWLAKSRYFSASLVGGLLTLLTLHTAAAEPRVCQLANPSSSFNQFMQNQISNGTIVGGVIAYYHHGKTDYYSFGQISMDDNSKPSPQTIYKIGSLTKVFTATLLATSVVDGAVTLTSPIDKYLPKVANLQSGVKGKINFEQLATHTASLPKTISHDIQSVPAFFNDFLNSWTPEQPIGQHYAYSNVGFQLLAYLLTQINNISYSQLLANRITKPLGMDNTASILAKDFKYPLAMGYHPDGNPIRLAAKPWNQVGYLTSNASDLIKFVQANLRVVLTTQELSKALALAQKPYFQVDSGHSLGLAWNIIQIPSNQGTTTLYDKDGVLPGYASYMGFNPATKTGIVILVSYQQGDANVSKMIGHLGKCALQSN